VRHVTQKKKKKRKKKEEINGITVSRGERKRVKFFERNDVFC
jgi:hypothetical protein